MKRIVLLLLAAVMITACDRKPKETPTDAPAQADTAKVEQVAKSVDDAPQPVFLFCNNSRKLQVIYAQLDPPEVDPAVAKQYNKLFMDSKDPVKVKFVGEQLNDPDGNPLEPGIIHNEFFLSPGLKYALVDESDAGRKDFAMEFGLLVADSYLDSHKTLDLRKNSKQMPPEIVTQLEQKYQMESDQSSKSYIIGENGFYGVLQFKPKDDKIVALDVVYDGTNCYSLPHEGDYYEPEDEFDAISYWNVDDEGEYFASKIYSVFETPEGWELYYVRLAAESCSCGAFCTKGNGELVLKEQANYTMNSMNEVENRPIFSKDVKELVKLYYEEDAENKANQMEKWCLVDVDYDGQDEVWIRSSDDQYGALFTVAGEPKLIMKEDEQMAIHVFSDYVAKGGSAGGPAVYHEYCVLRGSRKYQTLTLMEVYGEFDFAELNGKEVGEEEVKQFRSELNNQERDYSQLEWKYL